MSKVLLLSSGIAEETIAGHMFPIIGNAPLNNCTGPTASHEPYGAYIWRAGPGKLRKLGVRITANSRSIVTPLRLQIAGSDKIMVVNVPAGAPGIGWFRDDVNEDTIANGDEIQGHWDADAGTGTLTCSIVSVEWIPDGGGVSHHILTGGKAAVSAASSTRFTFPVGQIAHNTVEASQQLRIREAVTLSNFRQGVFLNPRLTNTVWTVRKNAVDGTLTRTFAGGEIDFTEDIVNSDSFAAGDLFGLKLVTGAGTESMEYVISTFLATYTGRIYQTWATGTQVIVPGTIEYVPFAGNLGTSTATEEHTKCKAPHPFTIKGIQVFSRTQTGTTDGMIHLRQNGVTVATITFIGAEVNWKENNALNIAVAADDDLNWMLEPGATGTSRELNSIGILIEGPEEEAGGGGGSDYAITKLGYSRGIN